VLVLPVPAIYADCRRARMPDGATEIQQRLWDAGARSRPAPLRIFSETKRSCGDGIGPTATTWVKLERGSTKANGRA
jgi:hypothetical protein